MAIGGKEFVMDFDYEFPSLTVDIIICSPDPRNTARLSIKALIDTGSDYIALPNDIINKLGLMWTGEEKNIEGWNGIASKMRFFWAKIIIEDIIEDICEIGNTQSAAIVGL